MNFNQYINDYEKYIDENIHGVFYAKDYNNVSYVLRITPSTFTKTFSITFDKISRKSIETEAEITEDLQKSTLVEKFNKFN